MSRYKVQLTIKFTSDGDMSLQCNPSKHCSDISMPDSINIYNDMCEEAESVGEVF